MTGDASHDDAFASTWGAGDGEVGSGDVSSPRLDEQVVSTPTAADSATAVAASAHTATTRVDPAEVLAEADIPHGAVVQHDGGVVIGLRTWMSRVAKRREVTAVSVAFTPEADDLVDAAMDSGSADAAATWAEDVDGFVVEERAAGSVVHTWVPATVTKQGDVRAARRAPGGRRRRKNVDGGRMHDHRIKVTPREEARLQVLARSKNITIPRLMTDSTFAPDTQSITDRRAALAELMQLGQVVGGFAVNMNQIAKDTNTGYALPANFDETLADVRSVMAKVREATKLLIELNERDLMGDE